MLSLAEPTAEVKPSAEKQEQQMTTTYYFIRHAEKDESNPKNRDPHLSEAGRKRAEKWAEVFKEVEFDLIFSSDFHRTRETANAIAGSQDKPVEIYDHQNLNNDGFQKKTKGKTVLVVGHTNTNPQLVNLLLEEKKFSDIDEKESGSLFIVTVLPNGSKTCQLLYIN